MTARAVARLWLGGGALAIVLLIVLTYVLAIKPVYDDTSLKEGQTASSNMDLSKLKHQVADLQERTANKATYYSQLAAKRRQLPDSYDIPSFLRQLQNSDEAVKVDNDSVSVAGPVAVPGLAAVVSLPITLSVKGRVADLTLFISRLQNTQDRAVVLDSISITIGDDDADSDLALTLQAFCSKNDESDCKVTA